MTQAVLGVLPILYNTVATLVALSRVRRMLRHSKLTALTRSDVVNRVIEVELPRYAVRPMDRFADREQYWSLSRHPSNIPGGSWTTFNWRMNVIGLSTQRIEYADQLRQPQVEVAFDHLVCYLLDLGAHPDPHGWRLLRSSGLWTPVGCTLMRAPDGLNSALTIAPLDGSDGHLSLAVTWAGPWTTRDHSHLPPYWVRLNPAPSRQPGLELAATDGGEQHEEDYSKSHADGEGPSEPLQNSESSSTRKPSPGLPCAEKTTTTTTTTSHSSSHSHSLSLSRHPITVQISADGIVTAISNSQPPAAPSPHAAAHGSANEGGNGNDNDNGSLYIDHLRVRPSSSAGAWFASAATAYGTSSQTILWNYKIPDDILAFARRETVPCGVLVLLGVVDEAATPQWATAYPDDHGRQLDAFMRRTMAQREALAAEARLPPAQRAIAERERIAREGSERMREMREKLRIQAERQETRLMEALQSPKWDTKLVAEHNLAWLVSKGEVDERVQGVKEAVGNVLHRMVLDGEFTSRLCRMLDLWKAWAENGGMRKSDLAALQEDQVTFAYATLLVAIIKDTSTALEGTVSMDLQECLRLWRTVRLG
ncbi:hypothetical protein MYCTH_2306544 [Thermothelomyces thermophilus ATCC 42464]|uniref:Uncharacterized protein n=1 Tax=Thermothelomyces thermophilus (strain ATCC 42464 / BCRC 31852 / DSM 1799) TaxID=573729 RepID=G2QHK3_THET4|nr:uncharacterized protein MYCTH_2306544 [Thermothelomyces thermophilus ATCC 42464]AEO58863.1 hypothetical protein MYCTH_2306544 [Thermothelomyces thermophilus ATCC 42464]